MKKKSQSKPAIKKASKKTTKQKNVKRKGPLPESTTQSTTQRLQRVLAHAGYGSRRECEAFIEEGRVEVDGEIVSKLGSKVDPFEQKIYVDGVKLKMPRLKYFALNKPPGVVSTAKDPAGRTRAIDLIKSDQRVYIVGRLDQSSEGLILVTNDGDLANQLTHPRYGVEKKYLVQVYGRPSKEKLRSLVDGVYLAEGKVRVANIKFKRSTKDTSWLEIVLDEGRNREIRRLLARIGHKVLRLRRIGIGPVVLGELPLGAHRLLGFEEVAALQRAVTDTPKSERRKKRILSGEKSSERRNLTKGGSKGKKKTSMKRKPSKYGKSPAGGRSGSRETAAKPAFKKRRAKGKSDETKSDSDKSGRRKSGAGKSDSKRSTSKPGGKSKRSFKSKSDTKRSTKRSASTKSSASAKPARGKASLGRKSKGASSSRAKKRGR